MNILRVDLRGGGIHVGEKGSRFRTTPDVSRGRNAAQIFKWPSYGKVVAKITSKQLNSRSSRTLPRATFDTHGAEYEPQLGEFPDEAIPTSTGYLPINDDGKSRLFYVFYEATHSYKRIPETPIVLWLNGGPGCSSLIGCFYELGPWRLEEKSMKLWRNEGSWNRRSGLLFIDQPIGVGFSIANSASEIPTDEQTLAGHLFYALQIWLQTNPSFMKRPIFVAGESYAGKYVPALAYFMLSHNSNPSHGKFSQFAGMAIGNGLTDPRTQILQAADTAFYLGLIDEAQTVVVRNIAQQLVALIDQSRWMEATTKDLELVMYIYKASGLATLLDIRRNRRYHHREDGVEFLALFLNSSATRAALKVDRASSPWQSNRPLVKKMLAPDVMKSAKWMVEAVLKAGYPVLLYQGVYDAKDGPACNEAWMRTIDWEHMKRFWASDRELWRVNRRLAGYWRQWKNLSHVVVHGAGHLVPYDQPMFSQDMIERWMANSLHLRYDTMKVGDLDHCSEFGDKQYCNEFNDKYKQKNC